MTVPFFVVHYTKNLDRRERLVREFKKYDITDVRWIEEYDRENLGEMRDLYQYNHLFNRNKLNDGLISVTIKHYIALKEIVENEIEIAVIMEDNVTFTEDIKKLVNEYLREANDLDWDIIFEGDTNYLRYIEGEITQNKKLYKKSNKVTRQCSGSTRCSNFYIINLKAAKRLHNIFVPFHNVCDHWSNYLFRKLNFNIYWVEPPKVHRITTHERLAKT